MAVFHDQGKSVDSAEASGAYAGPVSVGRFVAPIAGKALSRGGAALGELVSAWPVIAGPSLAGFTSPARLTRTAPDPSSGKKMPSVLHLNVDPAKALEVQYSAPQLIERINQTLGFKAVASLRLVQAPVCGARSSAAKRASRGGGPTHQPSHYGRGSSVAPVEVRSPLPRGEGQGEGLSVTKGRPAPEKIAAQAMPENRLSAALSRIARGVKARGCSG